MEVLPPPATANHASMRRDSTCAIWNADTAWDPRLPSSQVELGPRSYFPFRPVDFSWSVQSFRFGFHVVCTQPAHMQSSMQSFNGYTQAAQCAKQLQGKRAGVFLCALLPMFHQAALADLHSAAVYLYPVRQL